MSTPLATAPLAEKLRPQSIDDMVGQEHLLGAKKPLRNIIESGQIPNMIFYGPSGIGKTTLARIIARQTDMQLHKLNGTTARTADIKAVVEQTGTLAGMNGILLYLDEIQYFNKKQQQTLLEFIEDGSITLIASTTENPYFYVYNAILSRCTIFEFKPVENHEIEKAVEKAFAFLEKEQNTTFSIEDGVIEHIARSAGGDVRKSLNAVELCVLATTPDKKGHLKVTLETAKDLSQRSAMRYDRNGDEHYDIVSAYQKSMRGSDVDAALHYLGRLLIADDLPSACRRLLVCACEDVGLAYPMIMPIVKSCVDIAMQVGLPEARIPLANAVIMVCNAPKSNSGYEAISNAMGDIESGHSGPIPRQLQNKHYDGADNKEPGQFYQYPFNFPHNWVDQQYLPNVLKDKKYYAPGQNKNEQAYAEYWKNIKGKDKKL